MKDGVGGPEEVVEKFRRVVYNLYRENKAMWHKINDVSLKYNELEKNYPIIRNHKECGGLLAPLTD